MFSLNPKGATPLVVQIVEGFRAAIHSGGLRPGSKAPSIRQFAHAHGVSTYTVVDAYDRLVAGGGRVGCSAKLCGVNISSSRITKHHHRSD